MSSKLERVFKDILNKLIFDRLTRNCFLRGADAIKLKSLWHFPQSCIPVCGNALSTASNKYGRAPRLYALRYITTVILLPISSFGSLWHLRLDNQRVFFCLALFLTSAWCPNIMHQCSRAIANQTKPIQACCRFPLMKIKKTALLLHNNCISAVNATVSV